MNSIACPLQKNQGKGISSGLGKGGEEEVEIRMRRKRVLQGNNKKKDEIAKELHAYQLH